MLLSAESAYRPCVEAAKLTVHFCFNTAGKMKFDLASFETKLVVQLMKCCSTFSVVLQLLCVDVAVKFTEYL